jgi:hypothetical protein
MSRQNRRAWFSYLAAVWLKLRTIVKICAPFIGQQIPAKYYTV